MAEEPGWALAPGKLTGIGHNLDGDLQSNARTTVLI